MAQQNLDFNIVAHTKGMEAIAQLINRVGALEAETKKLATANAGLAASTNTVVQNGVRYNNALDAQSKQLRNARQGTQQLGMQINDFATSVSTGASISQAFSQQIGQVGYAMSMMGGAAGKVGGFLAGPWGALITIGAMALSPLIEKLWEVVTGAQKAEGALAALGKRRQAEMQRRFELPNAEKELNGLLQQRAQLQQDIAKRGVRDSTGRLQFVYREQKALEEVNRQIFEARQNLDFGRSEKYGNITDVMRDLTRPTKEAKARTGGGGTKSSSTADAERAEKRLAKMEEENAISIAKSKIYWAEYWSKREDEIAQSSIDASAKRAQELGYIIEATNEQLAEQVQKPYEAIQSSFQTIGNSVSDAFKGMLSGAMSWKDGMKSLINSVIDELWRLYVVQQIVGFVKSGLQAIGLPVPEVGKNANGTQNWRGGPTWVGERGPELVNLPRGSQVIPAHRAQNMGGSGVIVNVDARGAADPAAVRAQVEAGIRQAAPVIIAAAEARTVSNMRRPRLGGVMQ